jgi:hypothetical protein
MSCEPGRKLANLKQGDHVCRIFESLEEHLTAAVPFIKGGLARGERCLYISGERTDDDFARAMAAAGLVVALECGRGALLLRTDRETYSTGFW